MMIRAVLILQLATFCVLGMLLFASASAVMDYKIEQAELRVSAEYIVMMPVKQLSEIHI